MADVQGTRVGNYEACGEDFDRYALKQRARGQMSVQPLLAHREWRVQDLKDGRWEECQRSQREHEFRA